MESTLTVKVCGLNCAAAIAAATEAQAQYLGFIFYPPSPRSVTPEAAGRLAGNLTSRPSRVAVFVNPDDHEIEAVVVTLSPGLLQLHGQETPDRVAAIKRRFGIPVMKAIRISGPDDIAAGRDFEDSADFLLYDARPPADTAGLLPGGNGITFDWTLLAGHVSPMPWFLSGGLTSGNLAEAVRISGATAVDVSSGVEDRPGVKNIAKIRAFLDVAHTMARTD